MSTILFALLLVFLLVLATRIQTRPQTLASRANLSAELGIGREMSDDTMNGVDGGWGKGEVYFLSHGMSPSIDGTR
jgi:hypothetical protein